MGAQSVKFNLVLVDLCTILPLLNCSFFFNSRNDIMVLLSRDDIFCSRDNLSLQEEELDVKRIDYYQVCSSKRFFLGASTPHTFYHSARCIGVMAISTS